MIKAIIFDFDGVLVESVDIKTEAFRELFKNYPGEYLEKFVQYHLLNGGVSRFEKIKYFYREFLNKAVTQEELRKLCEEFSRLVVKKVIEAPYVPGAERLLSLCQKAYDMFVVSGTPGNEMNFIVRERAMSHFFRGVYGSPSPKTQLVRKILKNCLLDPNETVMIGDSLTDFLAAKENRIRFLARVDGVKSDWLNHKGVVAQFADLTGVLPAIQSLN